MSNIQHYIQAMMMAFNTKHKDSGEPDDSSEPPKGISEVAHLSKKELKNRKRIRHASRRKRKKEQ